MADFGKPQQTTETPKQHRPKKVGMYRKGADGVPEMISLSPEAARNLKSNPERINSYFDVAHGLKEKTAEDKKAELFWRIYKRTECLTCQDNGVFNFDLKRENGHIYTHALSCVCNEGERFSDLASYQEMVTRGLAQRKKCFLEYECQLDQKGHKCYSVDCNRFKS